MRLITLILILFFFLFSPTLAQGEIWLPVILRGPGMNNPNNLENLWGLVRPTGSTNYVLNPSAETTGNFTNIPGTLVTRSSAFQKYGLQSYRVRTTAKGSGMSLTLSALTDSVHTVTVRVRYPKPHLIFQLGSGIQTAEIIKRIDQNWFLYGATFSAGASNGATELNIISEEPGPGIHIMYMDGIQVEPLSFWTTYIDGTQEHCNWEGSEHASISTRSSQGRGGGEVLDFFEEFGFLIENVIGAGATNTRLSIDSYATLPGGELNTTKIQPREFTIVGKFIADSEKELSDKRIALRKELSADAFPGKQPVIIRYGGGLIEKEIKAFYRSGLEANSPAFYDKKWEVGPGDNSWGETFQFKERASIQFSAPNPYWLEVGESAVSLDTQDTPTFRTIASRLRDTGQWDNLGPPDAAGTYNGVNVMVEDNIYVYMGGVFTNWDNIADADNIVRYNKQSGVYSALGTGGNSSVLALALLPNGNLVAAGAFTSMGGVANTAYIAEWDGSAWNALGTGMNGAVYDLAVKRDGLLYATGDFTTAGGGAANFIASWNGSSWAALSTGLGAGGRALTFDNSENLFVGGTFLTAGGGAHEKIALWNGSAWSDLGDADENVHALATDRVGGVYAAGEFTLIGNVSAAAVAYYNGSTWVPLGSGLASGTADELGLGPDGILYIAGAFSVAGPLDVLSGVARWNGFAWAHLDVEFPSGSVTSAILASRFADAVVPQKYALYLGYTSASGTGSSAGLVTPDNEGTVQAFPRIVFIRSGGTEATIKTIKNERDGNELLLSYALLDGETLTIDLDPLKKTVISSFFGSRLDAILTNSDFGQWALLPGENGITSYMTIAGGPEVTAYMLWRDAFDSY